MTFCKAANDNDQQFTQEIGIVEEMGGRWHICLSSDLPPVGQSTSLEQTLEFAKRNRISVMIRWPAA